MPIARKHLLIAMGAIVAVLLGVLVAAIVSPDLNPLDYVILKPTEHTARFYPKDTFLYSYITLYPRGQQRRYMNDLWERFSELRSFTNLLEEEKEELEDQTGINFDDDVMPAIGPDLSFGILRFDNDDNPIIAGTVSLRDRDKAEILLEQVLDYLEDEEGALFEKDKYLEFPIWLDEDDEYAFALTEELIVGVQAEGDSLYWLEEMLDLVNDDSRESLADSEDFQEAMAALPGRRFASAFTNNDDYVEFIAEFHWLAEFLPEEAIEPLVPRWEAYSLHWGERAISFAGTFPTEDEAEGFTLNNPARLLPENTMAYLAVAGDFDMNRWQEELEEFPVETENSIGDSVEIINTAMLVISTYVDGEKDPPLIHDGAYADELLASILQFIEDLTDIDPEGEFFSHLGDETIVSLEKFPFEDLAEDPAETTVDASIIVEHREDSAETLEGTLRRLSTWVRKNFGLDTDVANVGAERPARVLDISEDTEAIAQYRPGYVINDGYLVLGTTEDALENVVSVQNGEEPPLATVEGHRRVTGLLPDEPRALFWIDLSAIVDEMERDEDLISRDQHRVMRRATGMLAVADYQERDHYWLKAALTLFPD